MPAGVSAGTPSLCRLAGALWITARSAVSTAAPSSGGRCTDKDSDPSSSSRQRSRRASCACSLMFWVTVRCARANRSSWLAVIGPAISARSGSESGVAIRVSARTLA